MSSSYSITTSSHVGHFILFLPLVPPFGHGAE